MEHDNPQNRGTIARSDDGAVSCRPFKQYPEWNLQSERVSRRQIQMKSMSGLRADPCLCSGQYNAGTVPSVFSRGDLTSKEVYFWVQNKSYALSVLTNRWLSDFDRKLGNGE